MRDPMATSPKMCIEPTVEQAIVLAGEMTKTIICEAVGQRGVCHVALSGGTTPQPMYQYLARSATGQEVPWADVEVFFGDERCVSLDNVESNYNMAQWLLLDHLPIEPDRVHPLRGDAENVEAAAEEYEQLIRHMVPAGPDGIPRFDLVLLGMGGDGHTASLFAGTAAENEQEKLVAANHVPVLGRMRLTFTFPLINSARNVMFLICGADKAEVIATVTGGDAEARNRLPAAKVAPKDGQLIYVMDAAAARQVKA